LKHNCLVLGFSWVSIDKKINEKYCVALVVTLWYTKEREKPKNIAARVGSCLTLVLRHQEKINTRLVHLWCEESKKTKWNISSTFCGKLFDPVNVFGHTESNRSEQREYKQTK